MRRRRRRGFVPQHAGSAAPAPPYVQAPAGAWAMVEDLPGDRERVVVRLFAQRRPPVVTRAVRSLRGAP